eukprot:3545703-Amphidinium_carterae.1
MPPIGVCSNLQSGATENYNGQRSSLQSGFEKLTALQGVGSREASVDLAILCKRSASFIQVRRENLGKHCQ